MVPLSALVTSLMLSLIATPLAGAWVYAIWIILINGISPGNYILLQKEIGRYFGNSNISFNYSLLFTNYVWQKQSYYLMVKIPTTFYLAYRRATLFAGFKYFV